MLLGNKQNDKKSPAGPTRREAMFLMACALGAAVARSDETASPKKRKWNYALASSLFGMEPLEEILAVTRDTGAGHIDLWPKNHGNQREQVDEMGKAKFASLLEKYDLRLGLTTRFDLGPYNLAGEIEFVSEFGGRMIVTGTRGRKGPFDDAKKKDVDDFVESLRPHAEQAARRDVVLAIENHSLMLLDTIESIDYFSDKICGLPIGIALAPSHLPQDEKALADLIRRCGDNLVLFYAWQFGKGFMQKLPKEEELMQLPGRGPLDFKPLLAALEDIGFAGFTEIFMHPTPRGIPILPDVKRSAAEIKAAKKYLG